MLRTNQGGLGQTVQVRKAWLGKHHYLKCEGVGVEREVVYAH